MPPDSQDQLSWLSGNFGWLLEVFLCIVYHANIVIRFCVLWVYINSFEELFDGLVVLAQFFIDHPYIVVNIGIIGIELCCFGIIFQSFFPISVLLVKNSAVEIMVTIFNNIWSRSFLEVRICQLLK